MTLTVDPYQVLDRAGDRDHLPRVLSTDDTGVSSVVPEDLLPVEGDFDGDGRADLAISGVYTLPKKTGAYFLLVVGHAEAAKPDVLYAQDSATPFYLHPPGTTGEGDPGDQAFSVTTCVECSTGTDFKWDARRHAFRQTAWTAGRITHVAPVPVAPETVSDATADKALRIAGGLPDVTAYVAGLKKEKRTLGTRVEPVRGQDSQARVLIFEKTTRGDKLYDAIVVDVSSGTVVTRNRRYRRTSGSR